MYEQRLRGVDAPWPLHHAEAERRRSLSSSVRAAVDSCFLHGFCTNGLGDTGSVLLSWWPGTVVNHWPWGGHQPAERGSPADDAVAATSAHHPCTQHSTPPAHTKQTATATRPLVRTTALDDGGVQCAEAAGKAKLGWRFLSVSDALDVHITGKTQTARVRQGDVGQERARNRKMRNSMKNQTMPFARMPSSLLKRQNRKLVASNRLPGPAHGGALEGGC
jgi:hypothetical protein